MTTPWFRVEWTLREWVEYAWQINHRPRCGKPIIDACTRHIRRFPVDGVGCELDRQVLQSLPDLISDTHPSRFGRPPKGYRADHWSTAIYLDAANQLTKLYPVGDETAWTCEERTTTRPPFLAPRDGEHSRRVVATRPA